MQAPFTLQQPFMPNGQPYASNEKSFWFIYCREKLVLYRDKTSHTVPHIHSLPFPEAEPLYFRPIGVYDGTRCMVVELSDSTSLPEEFTAVALREAYSHISYDFWTVAGRAVQLLHWHREHQFCGKCGGLMTEPENEPVKKCPDCQFLSYPRLSPAVIMSVIWDNKILMGRTPHFPKGMYSPLSGFVEPGETLEEAVSREVMEESGIMTSDIHYVASQPWPFPQSLMIGFSAKYNGGEIKVDTTELEDARWFSSEAMPEQLPSRMSISRTLIDKFLTDAKKRSA